MQLIQNQKTLSQFSFCISGIYIEFGILWNKRWASELIRSWNYRLQKAGLLICLKSRVSEYLWIVNMLKGPKGSLNLNGSIFVIFCAHSETESAWKILF